MPQYALSDLARAIYLLFGQLEFKDAAKNLLLAILEELIGSPTPSFQKYIGSDVILRLCA